MKKLLLLLAAFTFSVNYSVAQDDTGDEPVERPDRPERIKDRRLDKQLERIEAILDGDTSELSDRKLAFLESKKEFLNLQIDFRDALRSAVSDLGEDATEEERRAARGEVREQFADQFREFKEARRDRIRERRQAREDAAEEGEG